MLASSRRLQALAALSLLVLAVLAYWPGLSGPLLLDDFPNLAPVGEWLAGDRTWLSVVFGNRSGPLGRPISMMTFVLDAAFWGNTLWLAKLSNLMLHMVCGVLVVALYRRLLRRDPALSQIRWLPLYLAFLWLILPIHASSVLYLVQRMAILSSLFMLVGCWLYIVARESIERGERRGTWLLWLGMPVVTLLAALSKENGLLIPLLALAIEIAYFAPVLVKEGRPRHVLAFFFISVAMPALVAAAWLAVRPEWLLQRYSTRDFTLTERILSEFRILWDYVGSILVPYAPRLGIFHDDYPKSTDLLTPWTTLPAVIAWVAAITLAWRVRRDHPAIIAGALIFLAGHAMESTIWPLELYFEHRNYLPSVGILLAIAGIVGWTSKKVAPTRVLRTALLAMACLLPVTYLIATHGRARVWSSIETLYAQELRYNPDSARLRSYLAGFAMNRGDLPAALEHIAVAEANSPARQKMTISLWRALAYCSTSAAPPDALYAELEERARGNITKYGMVAWQELVQKIEGGRCPGYDVSRIIGIGHQWLESNSWSDTAHHTWRTRYYLARLYASQSKFDRAAAIAEKAWRDSGYNTGIGVFTFQVNASLERWTECRRIYRTLAPSRGGNLQLNQALDAFRASLEENERATGNSMH